MEQDKNSKDAVIQPTKTQDSLERIENEQEKLKLQIELLEKKKIMMKRNEELQQFSNELEEICKRDRERRDKLCEDKEFKALYDFRIYFEHLIEEQIKQHYEIEGICNSIEKRNYNKPKETKTIPIFECMMPW